MVNRISAEDAVKVLGHTPFDLVLYVEQLRRQCWKQCVKEYGEHGDIAYITRLTQAAIFTAGRVQGIREERARRKAHH